MKFKLGIFSLSLIFSISSFAGNCVMNVTRVSCPGVEKECFAKCAGKENCDEIKKVGSEEACNKEALKNCFVFRPGVTKSKKITATFDGKSLNGGKNYCDPVQKDFGYDTCK